MKLSYNPIKMIVFDPVKEYHAVTAQGIAVDGLTPRDFLPLLNKFQANHILQINRKDHDISIQLACLVESKKIVEPSDIESLCLEPEYASVEFSFNSSDSKNVALEQLSRFVNRNSILVSRARQIGMNSEELTLNAILSAQAAYKEMTGQTFSYSKGPSCQIRLAFDKKQAVLTCVDYLGSLRRKNMLERLLYLYSNSDIEVSKDLDGQSGIGLKVVVDNSTDFFGFCHRLKKTLVGCRLPLTGSASGLENAPKNFQVYFHD